MLIKHYDADFPERRCEDKKEPSQQDKQFMHVVSTSARLTDGHYCIKLPLKDDGVKMPYNRGIAEQRLNSLKRKFRRNSDFFQEYKDFMNSILEKGYATKVPEEQLSRSDGRVWFIPHHGVYHPKKRKMRVVFDCAATYQGTSLNDKLLQGPDLTNTLIGVLLRFRQEPVAIMADIESMFYQVRVPNEDADLLRFLWWPGGDLCKEATEYRMCVHLFGATSSPSCASYALRRIAQDADVTTSPETIQTVLRNFYVDDCLKSVATEEEAVNLKKELTNLCARGGFHLTKWVSNSRALLCSIPVDERAAEVKDLDLQHDELPVERALGMQWCTSSDSFKFKIQLPDKPCTRRGILSVVSSVYDPMGFLAPLLLPVKLILRDLCKEKKGWDEEISEKPRQIWQKWLADLEKLSELSVSRCFKFNSFGPTKTAQIHHFSDASQDGYGVVSYLLLTNEREEKHVCFLMGKSRVAPLKQVTIPRMELTAATVAVKADRMLKEELQVPLTDSVFWTDSMTVLKYIENDALRFKTFVANRVSFIREATTSAQWKYVNTSLNPADQTSRGLKIESFMTSKSWFQGPSFLSNKNEWPDQPKQSTYLSEHNEEVKTSAAVSSNSAARTVISECNLCRRLHAKVGEQKMADLPQDRLLPDKPPFTNTGVDYFGPFEIRRGRAKVKRYGVLFTCLTVRAVHLEVAHSLDTDSCINALRRFQARRGQVSVIRSDNGTNLVGAERELRQALKELDQSRINEAMMQKGVRWIFNPPTASHHGGIWERQIRTVRKVLNSVVRQQLLDDEGLQTFLCEVESIINGRPITTNTDDPSDLEPLTPNHLLLLKKQPSIPPGYKPILRVEPQSSVFIGDTVTLSCEPPYLKQWEFYWYKNFQNLQPSLSPEDRRINRVSVTVSTPGETEFQCAVFSPVPLQTHYSDIIKIKVKEIAATKTFSVDGDLPFIQQMLKEIKHHRKATRGRRHQVLHHSENSFQRFLYKRRVDGALALSTVCLTEG
ncbi:uncharacterized protein [Hoplias malabaricus]|uniref:uncharacterized protein n=1 Tax=Hoplias malabaricus TaxID=27720 RepID=UPI0034629C0E